MAGTMLLDGDGLRYIIGFACEDHVLRYVESNEELYRNGKISETKKRLGILHAKKFEDESVVEAIEAKYGYEATSYYQLADKSGVYLKKEAGNLRNCLHSVKDRMNKCLKAANCDKMVVYLSGADNFRERIAFSKRYKGNRDDNTKPLLFNEITKYLDNVWKAITVTGYEADDALAIVAMRYKEEGQRVVICTGDKDLRQVPVEICDIMSYDITDVGSDPWGKLFLKNANEGKTKPDGSPKTAKWDCKGYGMLFFYAQMLMGDTVDNIGGLHGCGAKRTYDILFEAKDAAEAEAIVLEAYEKKYTDEPFEFTCWDESVTIKTARDLMTEAGQLLYMMREAPNEELTNLWQVTI